MRFHGDASRFILVLGALFCASCRVTHSSSGSLGAAGAGQSVGGVAGTGNLGMAGAAGSTDTAPPLDRTVAANFSDAFAFICQGPNATQLGVTVEAIEPRRMAVIRGRVVDGAALPVAQVTVASPEHPEYGHTFTRADGTFDFVVNGGGAVRLGFNASGYLGVERELRPEWRSFERLREVFLTKLDTKVTEVALGTDATQQLVQGSPASDRSGARTGTLLFGAGTCAYLVLPDGTKQPLSSAHVRVTEYTVGDNGPKAMPAQLPPQSGYTYAVELTVDEATTAGATGVEFSQPVPYYVENFLNFPVGEPVPAGYYDRAKGQWVAAPSGRVIGILDVQGGSAQLDVDGDGAVDDQTKLTPLGITADELATLGATYAKGKSLWRVPVSHFSSWDFNWCFFGRLFDALADLPPNHDPLDDDCIANGSIIECQNQILGEALALTGLPTSLNYRSDRVPGRREAYQLDVQLTGQMAPPQAKRVRFELEILGQHVTYNADAAPNLKYHYEWDGKDGYGRAWQGPAPIRYRVGYVYDGWYSHTEVFGSYGEVDATRWAPVPDSGVAPGAGVTPEDDLPRRETTMWMSWQRATVGAFDASQLGFGGFTLSQHHTYDPESRTLFLGTGDRRHAGSSRDVVRALIGAVGGTSDAGGDPRHTDLESPHGVAVAPDGTIYVAGETQHQIFRLSPDGKIQVIAGTGVAGSTGDGGPAAQAKLNLPLGLALGKDGSLYIGERGNSVVRRINPSGVIETFAGGGKPSSGNGDGDSAKKASLGEPHSVAIGLDGSLFIVDTTNNNVRRVRPDGIIETVIGSVTGAVGSSGDGGPGTKALLNHPLGIALGPDGSLYVTEYDGNRVRRMAPDGKVSTVAGTGTAGDSGDGGLATVAQLSGPHSVDVAQDGSLYITDELNHRIRVVTPDGIIHPLTGGGTEQPDEYVPAQDAAFNVPRLVTVEPSGRVLIADYGRNMVYRLVPFLPSTDPNGYTIAADDGLSYFVFDRNGRHTKTVDSLTSQTLFNFDYDDAGRLAAMHDANGRVTKITRDATTGRATSITSPDGLASELQYASTGWLAAVRNPAGEAQQFTLSDLGLLTAETDLAGRKHLFEYDSTGRLTKDTEASGSFQTLTQSTDQSTVTRTTARGLAYVYQRSAPKAGGELRTTTLPDGRTVTTNSTPGHSVTQQANGSKVETQFASDPRFGLVAKYPTAVTVTTPSGLKAQMTASRSIKLVSENDPNSLKSYKTTTGLNGTTLSTEQFDVATLTHTSTALGVTTTTKFDRNGRVTEIDPPAGRLPIEISYNAVGRPSQFKQGSRVLSAFGYDSHGFLASSTDALSNSTTYVHDLAGRILSTEQASSKTQFTYQTGDLTALLIPNGTTHGFGYDSAGLNVLYSAPAVTSSTKTSTTYTYGVDDAFETISLPSGRKFERSIDSQGHLTNWKTPEAAVTVSYDSKTGNIATLATDGESIAHTWDGSLLLSSSWTGPIAGKVSWKYDNAFRPVSVAVGSSSVTLGYDSYGRLSQVDTETLGYASDGTSVSTTTCGQVSEALTYSSDYGELSVHKVTGSTGSSILYQATLTRDALGRITKKDETLAGTTTSDSFGYDALGRLTTATRAGVATNYTYDANGNRTDAGAQVDTQDRLLKMSGVTYAYNDDGQLLTKTATEGATKYTYDTLGQLRSVQLPSKRIDYVIDPAGRRVGKRVDGQFVKGFLYDAQGRALAELDGTGSVVSQFVYGSRRNVPDLMLRGGKTYRLVSDYLGSVRLVVETTTSSVAQQLDYDIWGKVTMDTSAGYQPFGFAGGLYDTDTGLVRFGARDYDPATGRWTNKDPILFGGKQTNLYVYVGDDPVNYVDRDGQVANFIIGGVVGAGANFLVQGLSNGLGNVDYGEVAIAGVAGALTGGLSAGATLAASLGYGAVGSIGQYAATQTYYGREITSEGVYAAGVFGAVGGAIGFVGAPTPKGLPFVEGSAIKGAVGGSLARTLNTARAGTVGLQNLSVQGACGVVSNAPTP